MTDISMADTPQKSLSRLLLIIMSIAAGLAVASLYYSQPLLGNLVNDFQITSTKIGILPTLTQAGYAVGMLFLTPLGDRFNRRKIILFKGIALTIALLLTYWVHSLTLLMGASLLIGLTATLAQDIIPMAAELAPQSNRGHTVGTVMTGLLCGILLSRVFSGFIGDLLGWRIVFLFSAIFVAIIVILLYQFAPDSKPNTTLSYPALIRSIAQIFMRNRTVRHAACVQGILSMGFSAYWTTIALRLSDSSLHLGSSVAGVFGLLGALGALLAPKFGKLTDRKGGKYVSRIGAALTAVSFAAMLTSHWASTSVITDLGLTAVATVFFDLGIQMSLIAHQNICYKAAEQALSRVNAILLVGVFIGMSIGSLIASYLYASFAWTGVVSFAVFTSVIAFVIKMGMSDPQS